MYSINYVAADALAVCFTDDDIESCSRKIAALRDFLVAQFRDNCIDIVPSYASLTIFVNFPETYPQSLHKPIDDFLSSHASFESTHRANKITLPCCYDVEFGPDLAAIARASELGIDEVIALHSSQFYRVYAIGFSPGFPYLGFVDERLAMPRLSSPRAMVPSGSVGIADNQTGIYPNASPGGWNIIGRCPQPLFNPRASAPQDLCALDLGDLVKFQPIDKDTFYEYLEVHQNRD